MSSSLRKSALSEYDAKIDESDISAARRFLASDEGHPEVVQGSDLKDTSTTGVLTAGDDQTPQPGRPEFISDAEAAAEYLSRHGEKSSPNPKTDSRPLFGTRTTSLPTGEEPSLILRNDSPVSVIRHPVGQWAVGSLRLHEEVVQEEEKLEEELQEKIKEKRKLMRLSTIQKQSNGTLILSTLPKTMFLGLDAAVFGVADKSTLVGVKGLPSGAHLLYGGIRPDFARSAVWFICGGEDGNQVGEVFVRKWNAYEEVIMEEVSAAEIRNQKEDIVGKEDTLIPYNTEVEGALTNMAGSGDPSSPLNNIWRRLTFSVSGEMLTRITGEEWNCWKVRQAQTTAFFLKYC